MNAPDSGRDSCGDCSDLSEPPPSSPANDQVNGFGNVEIPSLVLSRANLLAQAGVPADAVKRILDGHYDLWDDETVFWEEHIHGQGKLAMQLLRPAYDYPFGLASRPWDTDLTYMVRKAFPQERGPLPRMYHVSLVTPPQIEESGRNFKWLDEYSAPSGVSPLLEEVFPWGPAEVKLRDSGRFEFQVYSDTLPKWLRERLWVSFTRTLKNLWVHLNGTAASSVADPWLIRDMWNLGNCLPVGFNPGSSYTFTFLDTRQ